MYTIYSIFSFNILFLKQVLVIFSSQSHVLTLHHTHSEEPMTSKTATAECIPMFTGPMYEELDYLPSKVCTGNKGDNIKL